MANRQTLKRRRNRKNQKMRAMNTDSLRDLLIDKIVAPPVIRDFEYDQPIPDIDYISRFDACNCFIKPCEPAWRKKENKMNHMHIDVNNAQTATPTEQLQREYLMRRLYDVEMDKDREINKAFFIYDDDAPATPKELSERIAAGKFIIKGLDKNPDRKFSWNDWMYAVSWRDPSKPADEAGRDKAQEIFYKVSQKTKDTIQVKSPDEGLTALQALEAWVPTTTN